MAAQQKQSCGCFSGLLQLFLPVREEKPEAFVVGTGSAFGHHFSTEVLKDCFRKQRIAAGDTECDFDFADRVFDKCAFSHHSICFEEKDIFRRMTRPEYLDHRMTHLMDLAFRAAEDAIQSWGGSVEDITHLYWGTMTGAMHSPTIDILLAKKLGLRNDVKRVSIEGMGCLTGFRLMNLAQDVVLVDPLARVLCVEGECRSAIGSMLPAKATRSDIVSTALFRDAASAAIVAGASAPTTGESCYYKIICGRSQIIEGSEALAEYRELEDGALRLHLSPGLPDAVGNNLGGFAEEMISEARELGFDCPKVTEMDIICHTGGPKIVQEVCSGLGCPESALESTRKVMIHHGNLSGSSNMAVLDVHNRDCPLEEGVDKWCMCISMGPGVCVEGILMIKMGQLQSKIDSRKVSGLPGPMMSIRSLRSGASSIANMRSLKTASLH